MFDLHSTPMNLLQSDRFRNKPKISEIVRLREPVLPPTYVQMTWVHPDDPLVLSGVRKRKSRPSHQGEHIEIESVDGSEEYSTKTVRPVNTYKYYRRENICTALADSAMSAEVTPKLIDGSHNEIIIDDEINLELKIFEHGPVFLANITTPSLSRGHTRSRRTSHYRPTSASSVQCATPMDVDDNGMDITHPNSLPDAHRLKVDELDDTQKDEQNDEKQTGVIRISNISVEDEVEPTYDVIPVVSDLTKPTKKLSAIYVRPAMACFDFTNVPPGVY
ncbi:uncharacterized protein [Diadema setosum]|uniref:uncharacterized protein n=1 Tax=Diadema setosum TaxID=31175 RepID=UPI003B3B5A11